jgi:hypothetical protein
VNARRSLAAIGLSAAVVAGASHAPATAPAAASARPASIDAGWVRFDGWDARCPLWIPADEAALPSPIRWESCRDLDAGGGCRQMTIDWDRGAPSPIGVSPRLSMVDGESPRIALTRVAVGGTGDARSYKEWIVARADGPVEMAMRQAYPSDPGCTVVEQGVDAETAAFVVRGDGAGPTSRSAVDGLLLARRGSLVPQVGFRDEGPEVSSWAVGAGRVVRSVAPSRRAELFDLRASRRVELHDAARDPERLQLGAAPPRMHEQGVLFEVGQRKRRAIHAYDEARGAHPLVRGRQKSAGNVGTDGEQMVWTERSSGGEAWIMAAPFTTDPAALDARRVAIDPNPAIGAAPFAVGCGRAGHATPSGPIVVDLRTGAARRLGAVRGVVWGEILGLGCAEVFATYFVGSRANIARLPIDSLTL